MAAETVIKTDRGRWTVNLHHNNMIGNGAYGIVYKATDDRGNEVAAKLIKSENDSKLSKITTCVEELMKLDHPHIVKVLDVHREENGVWMIMELCAHRDLNRFVKKKALTEEEQLDIMIQLAEGVKYLHARNIVHRDIKPENILVTSTDPIHVKLTDFDVSKFLGEFYKTSAMSTDVGTLAFKAPELFQGNEDGKITYRRKADIYALGLTYLALRQRKYQDQKKNLLPRIETPRNGSEKRVLSIGQLIAERVKYKVPELNVVAVDDTAADGDLVHDPGNFEREIRMIIHGMTHHLSEQRTPANEVVKALRKIKKTEPLGRGAEAESGENRERPREESTATLAEGMRALRLRLEKTKTWNHDMWCAWSILLASDNRFLVYSELEQQMYIRVFSGDDGHCVKDMKSQCDHFYQSSSTICNHPMKTDCVLEACAFCKCVRSYNINTYEVQTVHTDLDIVTMCTGPLGSVIGVDERGCMNQLAWQNDVQQLNTVHIMQTRRSIRNIKRISYVEKNNSVIMLCYDPGKILAVNLSDGSLLWEFNPKMDEEDEEEFNSEQIDEEELDPHGLCHDSDGRVFISDLHNKRLLVLDAQSDKLLQVVLLDDDVSRILDMCWIGDQPQLALLQGGCQISLCDVTNQSSMEVK